jgi:hypothetical protein
MAMGAKQDFSIPPIGIVLCAVEAHEKFTRLV